MVAGHGNIMHIALRKNSALQNASAPDPGGGYGLSRSRRNTGRPGSDIPGWWR